jgi:hypothetical protein
MNDIVSDIPPHSDQLVSIDHLLKEQHSLGDIVKTEHTSLLRSIVGSLDELVTFNVIYSIQVRTFLSEFNSTIIQRLNERGAGTSWCGGGGEVGLPYKK